jgi:rubrerythrin
LPPAARGAKKLIKSFGRSRNPFEKGFLAAGGIRGLEIFSYLLYSSRIHKIQEVRMSMNVFDYAMQMEKDGENYYRDLAGRCPTEGLKNILNLLADDEVGHYNTFKALKEKKPGDIAGTVILTDAKNIFARMKEKEEETRFKFAISEIELYKKAIDIEKKSEAFYKEKAAEMDNSEAKKIFLKIAEDERKHQYLLKNMIEFLSRPKTWVENAEFHHLEEY